MKTIIIIVLLPRYLII